MKTLRLSHSTKKTAVRLWKQYARPGKFYSLGFMHLASKLERRERIAGQQLIKAGLTSHQLKRVKGKQR